MDVPLLLAFLGLLNYYTDGRHVDMFICGSNYAMYNPLKQVCKDGQVINKTTSPTTSKPNLENITLVDLDTLSDKRPTCSDEADILTCNGKLHCGRNQGYQCCGFDVYLPVSQICCQTSGSECCKLEVYARHSSDATCQHAANNDKFFQRQRLLIDHKICREAKYAFRIEIVQQINGQYLRARVGYWAWAPPKIKGKLNMRKTPRQEDDIDITLDQYSPMRKNLTGKAFCLFSSHQYFNDAVIYLKQCDSVYKCPISRRKMIRKLKKINRKCKHFA